MAVIYNSAKTRQKCRAAERKELLRDNRRREKEATRDTGVYLATGGGGTPDRKREKDIEEGVREYNKRATKVGDAREIGLRVLAKSSAIISARVLPPAYVRQK